MWVAICVEEARHWNSAMETDMWIHFPCTVTCWLITTVISLWLSGLASYPISVHVSLWIINDAHLHYMPQFLLPIIHRQVVLLGPISEWIYWDNYHKKHKYIGRTKVTYFNAKKVMPYSSLTGQTTKRYQQLRMFKKNHVFWNCIS